MRFKGFLFLTALAVLLGPGLGLSQFGGQPGGGFGQGGGGRGGRGGGGGGRDPGAMFDAMAKGKQAITKADVTNAFMQTMFDQVVTSSGSTNGQVTRDQWVTAMGQLQQQFGGRMGRGGAQTPGATTPAQAAAGGQATGNPFGGGQGAFGGAGAGRGGGNRGGGNNWAGGGNNNNWAGGGNNWAGGGNNWGGGRGAGGAGNWNPDTMADMRFRQLDANGDGLLNTDEMQADETLLAEHTKWDANGDGFIDQTEFREYFRARIQQLQANGPGGGMPALPGQDDNEPKPTVYRAGKLPPNLPAWFTQYDTDRDGQIGLYEWKAAGQDIARFEAMDINGDGFLTVEEVLRSPEVAQAGGRGTGGPLAMGQGTGSPGAFGQIPAPSGRVAPTVDRTASAPVSRARTPLAQVAATVVRTALAPVSRARTPLAQAAATVVRTALAPVSRARTPLAQVVVATAVRTALDRASRAPLAKVNRVPSVKAAAIVVRAVSAAVRRRMARDTTE